MENTPGTKSFNHETDKAPSKEKMSLLTGEQKKADHKEGPVARAIENQTAKLPSDLFLWLAGASMLGSVALKVVELVKSPAKERKGALSLFVGMWAPTLLILGLYNKIVKVSGSDQTSQAS